MKTVPECSLEYLMDKHIPSVVNLDERACIYYDEYLERNIVAPYAWSKNGLTTFLKNDPAPTGFVCYDAKDCFIGYILWEQWPKGFHIVALVVHPDRRREGYGSILLEKCFEKLQLGTKKTVCIHIHESDRDSQEFFKRQRFKSRLIKGWFQEEDGIFFTFTVPNII